MKSFTAVSPKRALGTLGRIPPAPGPNHSAPVAWNLEAASGLRAFSTRYDAMWYGHHRVEEDWETHPCDPWQSNGDPDLPIPPRPYGIREGLVL